MGNVCGDWIFGWSVYRGASCEEKGLNQAYVWDLAFWAFLAAVVGARLFHVLFYEPTYYLAHPLEIINPLAPGYAIFGGFIGATLTVWAFVKRKGLDF